MVVIERGEERGGSCWWMLFLKVSDGYLRKRCVNDIEFWHLFGIKGEDGRHVQDIYKKLTCYKPKTPRR